MHDPDEQGSLELRQILHDRIAAAGGITFAEYMELCLYQPDHGYYMTARERVGKGGDFFTSSSVHALFGALLARQLAEMAHLLDAEEFTIAEQGGGEGHLAADILDALAAEAPDLYRRTRYRLVEISPGHRERQRERLAGHAGRVDWCGLEELDGMEGCFLSNELVDAFPVHRVEMTPAGLRELFVVSEGEGFGEELRPPSTPALEEHFAWLGVEPAEGNRAEVNLAAPRWLRRVAALLGRGFVLTIDYGHPAAELYAPYRRTGTLACYRRHQSGENPFRFVGQQDITAHVDFTALELAGAEAGLQKLWFGPQYRFLLGLGFVEGLMHLQAGAADEDEARRLRLTLKNLILPEDGMGETFKVLIQGKGVGRPELLGARPVAAVPLPPGS